MDSADPQNRFEWRGCLRERLVKQAEHSIEKTDFKIGMIMMMMIMVLMMICLWTDLVTRLVF